MPGGHLSGSQTAIHFMSVRLRIVLNELTGVVPMSLRNESLKWHIPLTELFRRPHNENLMDWDIEFTDEFNAWWNELSADEQDSVALGVRRLEAKGMALGYPRFC